MLHGTSIPPSDRPISAAQTRKKAKSNHQPCGRQVPSNVGALVHHPQKKESSIEKVSLCVNLVLTAVQGDVCTARCTAYAKKNHEPPSNIIALHHTFCSIGLKHHPDMCNYCITSNGKRINPARKKIEPQKAPCDWWGGYKVAVVQSEGATEEIERQALPRGKQEANHAAHLCRTKSDASDKHAMGRDSSFCQEVWEGGICHCQLFFAIGPLIP